MRRFLAMVLLVSGLSATAVEKETAGNVRYRKAKDVNFEELLIQGQLRRQEIAVVTGDAQDGTDGLLRLRENFLDRVADDAGEEIR